MENHTPFPMALEIQTETTCLRTEVTPRNLKEIVRS
jgi:hypothetical protein